MDNLLQRKLQSKGVVLIEGLKWCGKDTTAEEFAASKVLLAYKNIKVPFRSLIKIDLQGSQTNCLVAYSHSFRQSFRANFKSVSLL